jgi:phosphoserine phosphatase
VTRFASVILDVDSTLVTIEGISWLAARRGEPTRSRVASVTDAAMRGDISLDGVYAERMRSVHPSRADVDALSQAYIEALQPNAGETISALQRAGVRVALVSGGVHQAVAALGTYVGIANGDARGVPVHWDSDGRYAGFETDSPLTRDGGKAVVARELALPAPVLAVGDGMTDAEMKPHVESFVAFTGTIARERVVAVADAVITSFPELLGYVGA